MKRLAFRINFLNTPWTLVSFAILVSAYNTLKLNWNLEFTTAHAFITGHSIFDSQFANFVFPLPAGENWTENGRTYVSYPILTFFLSGVFTKTSISVQTITFLIGVIQLAYIVYVARRITLLQNIKLNLPWKLMFIFPAAIIMSPGNFYFFTHIFYGDMFAITFCFALIHVLSLKKTTLRKFLIFIVIFLGSLTEFIFGFFLFFLILILFYTKISSKLISQLEFNKSDLVLSLSSFVTALTANIFVYQKDMGLNKLILIFSERRQDRGQTEDPQLIFNMARGFFNWNLGKGVFVLILSIMLILTVIIMILKFYFKLNHFEIKSRPMELSALGLTTLALISASLFHTFLFQNLFVNHFFLIAKFVIITALVLQLQLQCLAKFIQDRENRFKQDISELRVLVPGVVAILFLFCATSFTHQYKVAFDFAKDPDNINAKTLGDFSSKIPSERVCLSRDGFLLMPEIQRQVLLFPPLHYYSGKKEFYWSDESNGCVRIESVSSQGLFNYSLPRN
jgi:hypothetical protein